MRTILQYIPVKDLVSLVLDYAMVSPIMSNVLRDISDFEFDHDPSRYVGLKRYLRHRSIAITWSDNIFSIALSNYSYEDAEDIINGQLCDYMGNVKSYGDCYEIQCRIHSMNCSVRQLCSLCKKNPELPPGQDVESLLLYTFPSSVRGLIQSLLTS